MASVLSRAMKRPAILRTSAVALLAVIVSALSHRMRISAASALTRESAAPKIGANLPRPSAVRESPAGMETAGANIPKTNNESKSLQPADRLETWTREHPEDAMAWAAAEPNGPERVVVVEILCLQVAQTDPPAAVKLAEVLEANGYVVENIVQQWAERDLPAAQNYVFGLPVSPDRDRLVSRLASVHSKTNPREAARWVAGEISAGEIQETAAIAVLHQWTALDQTSAMAWVQAFPNSPLRDRALDELEKSLR